jgi:TRAP-type C4-dicarboxylate transport system substrate-binding protein
VKKYLATALCLALIAGAPAAARSETTEVRFGHNYPASMHTHRGAEVVAKYFNERNKRFHIKIYPAGQLFEEKGLVQGVQTGALDSSFGTSAAWGGAVPSVYVLDFPMLMGTSKLGLAAISGGYGKAMEKNFDKANVQLIGWVVYGLYDIVVNGVRPLAKPEDFKGLRLRSTGALHGAMVEALGGGPTVMSAGEVYMAMQRGTIDGTVTAVTSAVERKWYEPAKYATFLPLSYSALPITVSKRFWNKLDDAEKKALMDAGKLATQESAVEAETIVRENRDKIRKALPTVEMTDSQAMEIQKAVYASAEAYIKKVAGEAGVEALKEAEADIRKVQ